MTNTTGKSSAAMLIFAWLLVGIPLGWGVYNTVLNSRKLFQAAPITAAPPSSAAR